LQELNSTNSWVWQLIWENDIRRITVPDQSGQKKSLQNPISMEKAVCGDTRLSPPVMVGNLK
jgi:hypothetical protein